MARCFLFLLEYKREILQAPREPCPIQAKEPGRVHFPMKNEVASVNLQIFQDYLGNTDNHNPLDAAWRLPMEILSRSR